MVKNVMLLAGKGFSFCAASLVLVFGSVSVFAATKIEIIDLEGNVNTQMVKDKMIRMEIIDSGYMLIDMDKKSFHTIEPKEKRLIDMTRFYNKELDQASVDNRIKLSFSKIGKGPRIAGFKTVRYKMKINDFVCAAVYLSKEAYADDDINSLFKAFAFMSGKESMLGVSGDGDPCERAEYEMSEQQYQKYGVPMKAVSNDGHVDYEVRLVKSGQTIPAKLFKLPKSYERLDFEELYKLMQ